MSINPENPLNIKEIDDLRSRISEQKLETSLTKQELKEAIHDKVEQQLYRELERAYVDPVYNNQLYNLMTFIPAKGATPDSDGVYGLVKFRGACSSLDEANTRAEWIVENIDSYNRVFINIAGSPVPLLSDDARKRSNHPIKRINVKNKVHEEYKENLKKKAMDEKRRIDEIKNRERELLEDVSKTEEDPEDRYTMLRVKRAQICITFLKNVKLLASMIENVKKHTEEIKTMDEQYPDFDKKYVSKYLEACEKVGIEESNQDTREMIEAMKEVPDDLWDYKLFKNDEQLF